MCLYVSVCACVSVFVTVCVCVCICLCVAKAEVESRLGSAQTALMLQEDAIHRGDREQKQMLNRMSSLERMLNVLESEKQQLQVYMCHLTVNLLLTHLSNRSSKYF